MIFFPYESYKLITKLTPDAIRLRLQENIEPQKLFRLNFISNSSTKFFEGAVNYNKFRIQRIIGGRNSFLPIIEGKILNIAIDTEILITMRMAIYTYTIWLIVTGVLLFAFVLLIKSMSSKNQFNSGIIILSAMIIFNYLFAVLSFKWESSKAKKFLDNLFLDITENGENDDLSDT